MEEINHRLFIEGTKEAETRRAVWDLGSDKAPSPHGFIIEFFKEHRDIVKLDFIKVFEEFFINGKICKSILLSSP